MAPEQSREIDGGLGRGREESDHLQVFQDGLDIRRHGRLDAAHHDVLAAFLAAACLVQHPVGLPDAGRVAQEDLEPPLGDRRFLGLDLAQEFFGRPSAKFTRHAFSG